MLAVYAVAVTNSEKMSSAVLPKVRQDKEGILVHFIRVFRRIAGFGREGKFGNAVVKLFARLARLNSVLACCGDFFRD